MGSTSRDSASRGVCNQGSLHPRASASGGSASRGREMSRPPIRYYEIQSTSGQYASYCNAFLFN